MTEANGGTEGATGETGGTGGTGDGATISDAEAQLHIALAAAAEEAEKWKTLSRKNESQATKNADAARQLAELQAKGLSDPQQVLALKGELATLQSQFKQGQLETARFQSIGRHGLTPEDAPFLTGETPEEIDQAAALFAARLKAQGDAKPAGGFGTDFRQGTRGNPGGNSKMSGNDLIRAMAGRPS